MPNTIMPPAVKITRPCISRRGIKSQWKKLDKKANNLNNLKFLEFKKYPTDAVNVNPNRTEAKLEFPTVKTITPANSD